MTTEETSTHAVFAQLELEAFDAELGEALAMLQATKDMGQDDPAIPDAIHHKDVELIPNVFQVRGTVVVESHVSELLALLRQGRKLDPITLWRCGRHALLVDGHHRVAAYQRFALEVNKTVLIPCQWLDETTSAAEAMELAAETNTKIRLSMPHSQRADLAWRMVKAGPDQFSKATIARLSGVSSSLVATMRKTWKELGDAVESARSWASALMKRQGLAPLSEEQHKARDAETVGKWVSSLSRHFGNQWYLKRHLVSDALDQFLGRASPDVAFDWVMGSEHIGRDMVEGWLEDTELDPEADF